MDATEINFIFDFCGIFFVPREGEVKMAQAWGGIKDACQYAGRCERTVRNWLAEGLRHSRLPSGRILIKFDDIDNYLSQFAVTESEIDRQVSEMLRGMGRRC